MQPMTLTEQLRRRAEKRVDVPEDVSGKFAAQRRAKQRHAKQSVIGRAFRRVWVLLVIMFVVAITGFCVYRLHGIFGVHGNGAGTGSAYDNIVPFNPKVVVLEVWGSPGNVATINYLDVNAQPQQVLDVTLPWSFTITTTLPAVAANLVAQGNGDSIGCRITVDGVVKNERQVNEVHAYTFCLDKSA
jgi:Mycobacterium membrane protein